MEARVPLGSAPVVLLVRGALFLMAENASQILRLCPSEPLWLDPKPVVRLFADYGVNGAEKILCTALDEISDRLVAMEDHFHHGRYRDVLREAEGMMPVARQVGFRGLASVAADVANCARFGDPAALAATLARLMRIAHRSLAEVWDDHLGS